MLVLLAAAGVVQQAHGGAPNVSESARIPLDTGSQNGSIISCSGNRCAITSQDWSDAFYYGWSPTGGWNLKGRDGVLHFPRGVALTETMVASKRHYNGYDDAIEFLYWPDPSAAPAPPYVYITPVVVPAYEVTEFSMYMNRLAIGNPPTVEVYDRFWDPITEINNYEWSNIIINGGPTSSFGMTLDLVGDELVVGMPRPGDPYGLVYHYTYSAATDFWFLQDVLTAPIPTTDDRFGSAIVFVGKWLAVGAPNASTSDPLPNGTEVGAVHLYELVEGHFLWRVGLYGGFQSYAHFGASVAIDEFAVVGGAPGESLDVPPFPISSMGAAYLYWRHGNVWNDVPQARLYASDFSSLDSFGFAVALSGEGVLVGAPGWDESIADDRGTVYFFEGLNPLFIDGFESGDTTAWSNSVP